jgi:hypothetical protein
MKNSGLFALTLVTALVASQARADIVCKKGFAETSEAKISIQNLTVSKEKIVLTYTPAGQGQIVKTFITLDYRKPNGSTDRLRNAYFYSGSESGREDDFEDIALPHYGEYKKGLGSEIAFNYKDERAVGLVSECEGE